MMSKKKNESVENKYPNREQVEHYKYLGSIINQNGRCINKNKIQNRTSSQHL
jgi:hypothetical protein